MKSKCENCKGKGEWENHEDSVCQFERCPDCNGTGEVIETDEPTALATDAGATPIITGEDAERFEANRGRVDAEYRKRKETDKTEEIPQYMKGFYNCFDAYAEHHKNKATESKEHKITKKRKCSKYCDWPECKFDECIMEEGKTEEYSDVPCDNCESDGVTGFCKHCGWDVDSDEYPKSTEEGKTEGNWYCFESDSKDERCESQCEECRKDPLSKEQQSEKGELPTDVEILLTSSDVEHYKTDERRIGFQEGAKWMREESKNCISQAVADREKEIVEGLKKRKRKVESVMSRVIRGSERWRLLKGERDGLRFSIYLITKDHE